MYSIVTSAAAIAAFHSGKKVPLPVGIKGPLSQLTNQLELNQRNGYWLFDQLFRVDWSLLCNLTETGFFLCNFMVYSHWVEAGLEGGPGPETEQRETIGPSPVPG